MMSELTNLRVGDVVVVFIVGLLVGLFAGPFLRWAAKITAKAL